MHHNTVRDLHGYLNRFNDFTTWSAADLHDKGTRFTFPRLLLRPVVRFLKMYVIKLGFLEGRRGLMLCGFAAFNVFTKYAKLWEIEQQATDDRRQTTAEEQLTDDS